jgi:hypothetical protein
MGVKLVIKEEQILAVFENGELRRIFAPQRGEATEWQSSA